MNWPLKIQGRLVTQAVAREVRELIKQRPDWHRTRLSKELCHLWNWRRPDGQLKDMACRELLRKLESRGVVDLPPARHSGNRRPRAVEVEVDETPLRAQLSEISPVGLVDARTVKSDELVFNHLLSKHHYLGFSRPVGQNMKYLIKSGNGRPLGCLLFGAAAWKVADRDRWIGWDAETRKRNLNRLCNNTRFLIAPWVTVPHLASHALSLCLRRLARDWTGRYGLPVLAVETFVDASLFKGTCYKAANWLRVGATKGRSRQDRTHRLEVPVKNVYVFPLTKHFREELSS